MLPPPPLYIPPEPIVTIPHARIEIIGDANFSATAQLEGWPGDGTPENPYIIDGLGIDLEGGNNLRCIEIRDTQVSFTISNCNLTRAYAISFGNNEAGIYLENVMNGELVDNIVNCNDNGIILYGSDFNTVANNFCSNNSDGIVLYESDFNTVANNTCYNNRIGIYIYVSKYNTVVNNTCWRNTEQDILQESYPREYDPEVRDMTEFLLVFGSIYIIGFSVMALLGGILIVYKRVSKDGN
jgi:parallel beta-helix repeat protein